MATAVTEKISAMKTAEFFTSRGAKADIKAARRILRRRGGQPLAPEDRLPVNTEFTYLQLIEGTSK